MSKNHVTYSSKPDSLPEYLGKVWNYRALIWEFAKRDLRVKYANTFLGISWSILQPTTSLFVFTFFFGYVLNWSAAGLPYPIYVLSGLLGWNLFSYIVFQGTNSIQESSNIIKKIYFPKAILPLSKVAVAAIELLIAFLLLIPLLFLYRQSVSSAIVFVPIVVVLNTLAALSLVLTFSSLISRRKDLYHLIPFLMYFGIWFTPVFFTRDTIPENLHFIWFLNPMAAIVELWRWCLFPNWTYDVCFIPGLFSILIFFTLSMMVYKNTETEFSDFA